MVGGNGIEPLTSALSELRSTTELAALFGCTLPGQIDLFKPIVSAVMVTDSPLAIAPVKIPFAR